MADDYYKTLGVSRTADAAEIRKAYRKLARENHPDRNPDDPKASETFKAVGEAYGVLSDADKRAQYDRFGSNYKQFGGGRPGGGSPFGGGGGHPFGGAGGQQVDMGDLFGDGFDLNDLLGGLGGAGRRPGSGGSPFGGARTRPRKGSDVRTTVTVPFTVAALGGEYELNLDRGGKRESLTVKIPAGIADGGTMRLAGKGEPGGPGGTPGDLLLTIKTAAHPTFRRDGANLVMDLPLTPAEAALGAKVDVPTLSEGTVTLTIPPGAASGSKLRLRGKGVKNPKSGTDGDQIVQTKIVVPKALSDRQRELYEELLKLDDEVRSGLAN
ncbi:DnaJ C-terminal domain-containing protein [Alienimonas chondri]|uniref:Chaperone protein DnaJ n=1 Tax=Alienimonas chondri TaxID=2681879 RepID=A0ABX1VF47_9PLAN|nr:DnaJ C-terminal domain-containing protein [Alienimonas chondri]NNJ26724.1 Chaperone protein DnaJ [Alienimonas chondri]